MDTVDDLQELANTHVLTIDRQLDLDYLMKE